MNKESRFEPDTLEEMRRKNYDIVTDLASKLNMIKGYETAYTNPQKGKMIVDFKGQLFLVDIEPIECIGDINNLSTAMKQYGFMFKDEINGGAHGN